MKTVRAKLTTLWGLSAVLSLSFMFGRLGHTALPAPPLVLKDSFGRNIQGHELQLIDWEGAVANPALKLEITPDPALVYPLQIKLFSGNTRIEFSEPSTITSEGSAKTLVFEKAGSQVFWVSDFSDRNPHDVETSLKIEVVENGGRTRSSVFPMRILSREPRGKRQPALDVILDYSQDQSGFFKSKHAQELADRAADDWAYYLADHSLVSVPIGTEQTWIWNQDGFKTGQTHGNSKEYKGFLLYAVGIHHAQLRSGGNGSREGKNQQSEGKDLRIKRSGSLQIETQGNFNEMGWFYSQGDQDWWVSGNLKTEKNDLYSIIHHEIGHALFFDDAHPKYDDQKKTGVISSDKVLKYLGHAPTINKENHFEGAVDPVSLRGAFGNEYQGIMPKRRWTMTKLDLLLAATVGYRLRSTSVTEPLLIGEPAWPAARLHERFEGTLAARNGVPFFQWEVGAGSLPPGLVLDSFSGTISGSPSQAGIFRFTIRLRDSDPTTRPVEQDYVLEVKGSVKE